MLRASLQCDPYVEGADQSCLTYANAGLVQDFHLQYGWPSKCIGIVIFMAKKYH